MIKYFTLVCDLLQLPISPQYISFAEQLVKNPHNKIISFSSFSYIFFAFQDFLLGTISQEDFVAFWDSFGTLYRYQSSPIFAKEALFYWLLYDSSVYEHCYIVFPLSEKEFLEENLPDIQIILKKLQSQIFYI